MNKAVEFLTREKSPVGLHWYHIADDARQLIAIFQDDDEIAAAFKSVLAEANKRIKAGSSADTDRKNFINALPVADKIKQVLMLKYVEKKTAKEIANLLHYSTVHIFRLHKQGIEAVNTALEQQSRPRL